jgi:hypothetical protein
MIAMSLYNKRKRKNTHKRTTTKTVQSSPKKHQVGDINLMSNVQVYNSTYKHAHKHDLS